MILWSLGEGCPLLTSSKPVAIGAASDQPTSEYLWTHGRPRKLPIPTFSPMVSSRAKGAQTVLWSRRQVLDLGIVSGTQGHDSGVIHDQLDYPSTGGHLRPFKNFVPRRS